MRRVIDDASMHMGFVNYMWAKSSNVGGSEDINGANRLLITRETDASSVAQRLWGFSLRCLAI